MTLFNGQWGPIVRSRHVLLCMLALYAGMPTPSPAQAPGTSFIQKAVERERQIGLLDYRETVSESKQNAERWTWSMGKGSPNARASVSRRMDRRRRGAAEGKPHVSSANKSVPSRQTLIDTAIFSYGNDPSNRELYAYDEHGWMICTLCQYHHPADGWGNGYEILISYDDAGRQTSRQLQSASGAILSRATTTYDHAGRQTSYVCEGRSSVTNSLEVVWSHTTVYNDSGRPVFDETLGFDNGQLSNGYRNVREYDSQGNLHNAEEQLWNGNAWRRVILYLGEYDSAGKCISFVWENHWDSVAIRYSYLLSAWQHGDEGVYLTEQWIGARWIPVERTTSRFEGPYWLADIIETCVKNEWTVSQRRRPVDFGTGFDNCCLTEQIENGVWVNFERSWYIEDITLRNDSGRRQEWVENRWRDVYAYHIGFSPTGDQVSSSETTWVDGQIERCGILEQLEDGTPRFSLVEIWEGGIPTGEQLTFTYNSFGRKLSEERSYPLAGVWAKDYRREATYDESGRVRALSHFRWERGGWESSFETKSGNSCRWVLTDDAGNEMEYDVFSLVTFGYRGIQNSVAEVQAMMPQETNLAQNYPNPFNSSTSIVYQVAGVRSQATVASSESSVANRVKLAVYDMLGREVAVLVDEQKAPGSYSARFDAGGISSGTYFYRLEVGGYSQSSRMLLVR